MHIHLVWAIELLLVGGALGGLFALAWTSLIGPDILVLVAGGYLFFLPGFRWGEPERKPILLAYAVLSSHALWSVYALAWADYLPPALLDVAVVAGGITWLLHRPGWDPAAILIAHHAAMALILRPHAAAAMASGGEITAASLLDPALRGLAVCYLIIGVRGEKALRRFFAELRTIQSAPPSISYSTLIYFPRMLRELPPLLEPGEAAELAVSGRHRGRACLAVATERRLILIGKGEPGAPRMKIIPAERIQGLEMEWAFLSGRLRIRTPEGEEAVGRLTRSEASDLYLHARARLADPPSPPPQEEPLPG